jgi:hypothetical protein
MSLDLSQSLASLGTGQAMLVAPALGESYAGKTAGSIAFLLLLLANGLEARLARLPALAARIESLLADAPIAARADPAVAGALAAAASGSAEDPQRFDRLMGALAALHAWADAADSHLASSCLNILVDWADSECPDLPVLPG